MKIKSITKEKNEDVFDIQMSNNHNFYANSILIHNCEIALRPYQFCNLCEVNVSDIEDQDDFNGRVRAASFIGTLQASYTNFHYLRDVWKKTTEKEALIGISMTGIASGKVLKMDMDLAASIIKNENKRVAEIIGIKPAARTTAVKPAGTTSLTLGTSSGIHAWHNDFYIRRLRINKSESIYNYLINQVPELMEDDFLRPHDTSIISIPQMAPKGSILRTESALSLLNRIKFIHDKWIKPGHISGQNTHNVSATVSIKDDEWDSVGEWMWLNKDSYNGLSVMPYSDHTYKQTPYEDISEDEYYDLYKRLKTIDLDQVYESDDMTNLSGEIACSGGACEII